MNEQEHKKLCMARYIYREGIIDQLLPSVIRGNENKRNKPKKTTWRDWWLSRYKENYDDYTDKARRGDK